MPAPPTSATAELIATLAHPDGPLEEDRPPRPLRVAAATAIGLGGAGAFLAVGALGLAAATPVDGGAVGGAAASLVAVPPLTFLLSVPPLYLATALRGRAPGLLRLMALGSAGPTAAGTWLGATTPLLLLYLMTGGQSDVAFVLLGLLLGAMAVAAGVWGAARASRRAGPQSPGLAVALGHYGFSLWTMLVLSIHLVR